MKKIAFFVGEFVGEYQIGAAQGIIEAAAQDDVQIVILTNSGSYGDNIFYAFGEKNIINMPVLADYAGIIIAADTFGIQGMYEELAERLVKEAVCPVVCLRCQDERFYSVLADNYTSMCDEVEHFIKVHGCKRICFMTGILQLQDAQVRLQGYRDTMAKYGLPVTEKMIFEGDYWRNKGREAVSLFFDDAEEPPEAIVCSNDYMAVAVRDALRERGIRIPEDVLLAGFDDVEEARLALPPMSSMHISPKEIGRKAYEIIRNVNAGKHQEKEVYVEATPCFRGSCGCGSMADVKANGILFDQKEKLQNILYRNMYLNLDLQNENTFEELMETAFKYSMDFPYREILFCFCDEKERMNEAAEKQTQYTEQMVLRAVLTRKDFQIRDEKFARRDILPKRYLEDKKPIYVYPLHEKNACLGYVVLKAEQPEELKHTFQLWIFDVANAIERMRMYLENQDLMKLRLQHYKDELTGIGNRRAMDKELRRHYERMGRDGTAFCIMSIDMDGLKYINDNMGHIAGDRAICAMAEILKSVQGEKEVAARIGGDEYMMCLGTDKEEDVQAAIGHIRQRIEEYNRNSEEDYRLSASIGYAFCRRGMDLMTCMNEADSNMYNEKRGKKEARR